MVLIAITGAIVWQLLHLPDREPVYQGKRLSFWLIEYRSGLNTGIPERVQAQELAEGAVRRIGTNGIPTLLNMLGKKDSVVMSRLVHFWGWRVQQLRFLPAWVLYPGWWRNAAWAQNDNAALGFEILGADAQPAVPALIRLYEKNVTPRSQAATSRALNAVGPAAQKMALPSFLRGAASSDGTVREVAVSALYGVDVEPGQVVPALVHALSDTNWFTRLVAAEGLGHIGTNAQEAVPAIIPLLSDPQTHVRGAAKYALQRIDPEAAAKAGVK